MGLRDLQSSKDGALVWGPRPDAGATIDALKQKHLWINIEGDVKLLRLEKLRNPRAHHQTRPPLLSAKRLGIFSLLCLCEPFISLTSHFSPLSFATGQGTAGISG